MSQNILNTLIKVGKSARLLLRNVIKKEEEIEKMKLQGIICKVNPSLQQQGLWTLEFINETSFEIRVLKVSAESIFAALIRPNYSVPERPTKDYIEPKANPLDEIILRNIKPNGSLIALRELSHHQRYKETWMNAQISIDNKMDETFPLKSIKVTINV